MQKTLAVVPGPELNASQLHALLRLRVDIFVVEQECPYPEIDGLDLLDTTRHLWFSDDTGPTAYLRILSDPHTANSLWRIGRVVTRVDARGAGLAGALMESALTLLGSAEVVLEAQAHLSKFYETFGFVVCGDEYIEDGIPHLPMIRANPATS